MNNCFKTIFEGYELLLPKSSVIFKNGIGIVNAHFRMEYDNFIVDEPLIGIVDQNYKFIIELFPKKFVRKIDLFVNDIIMEYTDQLAGENEYVFLIPMSELDSRYNLLASDYNVVDNNLIILKNMDNDLPICALFDVSSKKLLTPYYNSISDFKSVNVFNEEVAKVEFYIRNESYQIISKIEFYINKKGDVVSLYKNTMTNNTYDSSLEFEEVLELARNDILNSLKLVK